MAVDFKKLETFRAVARRGSLKQAASLMRRTIPAISLQIKSLEEEIGIPLFHHLHSKLVLTEQGRSFLEHLDGVFDALERAKSVASQTSHEFTGNISMALGSDLSIFFAPRIADFARRYPNVRLSLVSAPTSRSLLRVSERESDIGVGFYRTVPAGLHKSPIMETGITLVLPRGSALRKGSAPTLEQICEQRVIMLSRASETRRMIDEAFAALGQEPSNIIEVASCRSAIEFVALGLGVGLVHGTCACAESRRDLTHIDMADAFGKLEVGMVTRRDILVRPAHAAFIKALTTSIGEDAARSTAPRRGRRRGPGQGRGKV